MVVPRLIDLALYFRIGDLNSMIESSPNNMLIQRVCVTILALVAICTVMIYIAGRWEGDVGFFWFSFFSGVFGASLALLRKLQKEPVLASTTANSWLPILMPLLYGGMLASVTYFLFVSEILSGTEGNGFLTTNLFPNFTGSKQGDMLTINDFLISRPKELKDVGRLVVWGFIGGYSEGFVTGMLGRLDRHTSEL